MIVSSFDHVDNFSTTTSVMTLAEDGGEDYEVRPANFRRK